QLDLRSLGVRLVASAPHGVLGALVREPFLVQETTELIRAEADLGELLEVGGQTWHVPGAEAVAQRLRRREAESLNLGSTLEVPQPPLLHQQSMQPMIREPSRSERSLPSSPNLERGSLSGHDG